MRHKVAGNRLSRNTEQLKALKRSMAVALFRDERIVTTREKAKALRPFIEKLITRSKTKNQANIRYMRSIFGNAAPLARHVASRRRSFSAKEVVAKLFDDIGPRNLDRPGGYTRIIALPKRRQGDAASQVIFELVEKTPAEIPAEAKK